VPSEFTEKVIRIISNIPAGKVLSYGSIAVLAGNPRGARQVSWILSSMSGKYKLPWHRVINSMGKISLRDPFAREEQKARLESEGIVFSRNDIIDFSIYFWQIRSIREIP